MPSWVQDLFRDAYRDKDMSAIKILNERWFRYGYYTWKEG